MSGWADIVLAIKAIFFHAVSTLPIILFLWCAEKLWRNNRINYAWFLIAIVLLGCGCFYLHVLIMYVGYGGDDASRWVEATRYK